MVSRYKVCEGGEVSLSVSFNEGGVACLSDSHSEGGVVSVSVSLNSKRSLKSRRGLFVPKTWCFF